MIENNFYLKSGYKQINFDKQEFRDYATGSTIFPNNVAPINTYGDQYMQKTYKPHSNNSIIYVLGLTSFSFGLHTCALFVDDVVNAIGAATFRFNGDYVSGEYINISLTEKTFYFRAGLTSAGTLYFNRFLNQNVISAIIIKEFIKL